MSLKLEARVTFYKVFLKMIQELIKGISHKLRQKHTDLRIEGHPKPSPRIIIRNVSTFDGIDVYFVGSTNLSWSSDETTVSLYFTTIKNKSKIRRRSPNIRHHNIISRFDLIDPNSIEMIISKIEEVFVGYLTNTGNL